MKRFVKRSTMVLLCLAISVAALATEESKEAERLEKATLVLNEIMQTPDKGIPQDFLDRAVCVGIVPSELRFAFVVGGNYGKGLLVCRRGGDSPWGAPSFFTLGGGSIGFQIGGKATDVVFIVMNSRGAKKLLQSKVKLGVDASAAPGPVGGSGEGATDVQSHAELLTRSWSAGHA